MCVHSGFTFQRIMIKRPVKFPCSAHFNAFRCLYLPIKQLTTVGHDGQGKRLCKNFHRENPFFWASEQQQCQVEHLSPNEVHKLQNSRLTVYPVISQQTRNVRKPTTTSSRITENHHTRSFGEDAFGSRRDEILAEHLRTLNYLYQQQVSINKNTPLPPPTPVVSFHQQVQQQQQQQVRCDDDRTSRDPRRPRNEDKRQQEKDLPTHAQLNDMMDYFVQQSTCLFSATGWTYRKATYNIVFENVMFKRRTEGLRAYIQQVNMLKLLVRVMLRNPELHIYQMSKDVTDGRIDVRWHVSGEPRTMFKPLVYFDVWNGDVDGTSVFYVNSSGLYYKHILMKMSILPSDLKCMLTHLWFSRARTRAIDIMKSVNFK